MKCSPSSSLTLLLPLLPPSPSVRHPVRAVLPRQQGWWEWLVNLAFFPLRFVINTTSEFMQFIGEGRESVLSVIVPCRHVYVIVA